MEQVTKNINTEHEISLSIADKVAMRITEFSGRVSFIVLHTIWFVVWFTFRLDINLLTLIVSLEAIYLSSFIMINQNQQDKKNRFELDHDYETNLRAEQQIEELHSKVDKLLSHENL